MNQNITRFKGEWVVFGLLFLLFLSGCVITPRPTINDENKTVSCISNKECVPDACCHARGAVNSMYGPSCSDVMCSMNCEEGTLDCGQGMIKCVKKQCAIVSSDNSNSLDNSNGELQ